MKYIALKAYEIWEDDIDFFYARDLYGLIDSVSKSEKPIHFVVLDDQVFYLDSRNPSGNKSITQTYFTIRHKLKEKAVLTGGNVGGLVICAILVQSWIAMDKRLRKAAMFSIFKTFDEEGCSYYKVPENVRNELAEWQKESTMYTNYEARKYAWIVDKTNEGCLIEFNLNDPIYQDLPFKFQYVSSDNLLEEQKQMLIEYVGSLSMGTISNDRIRAKLFVKLNELKSNSECLVSKNDFQEIILRARDIYYTALEKENKEKKSDVLKEPQTILERIKFSFIIRNEKILSISDINSITHLQPKQISETISRNSNDFSKICRGYWCLKSNAPSDEEINKYKTQNFETRNTLVMNEA